MSGLIAGLAILPSPHGEGNKIEPRSETVPFIRDTRLKELCQRGLDAAQQAGAEYADVRLTYTRQRKFENASIGLESEWFHVGFRVLINGFWGFAASPLWHPEEMVRLGREATHQAKVNAQSESNRPSDTVLLPLAAETEREGHWETPVRIDAFTVHPKEIRDHLLGINEQLINEVAKLEPFGLKTPTIARSACVIRVQEKAFCAMDGRYYTQRLHQTAGGFGVKNLKGLNAPGKLHGHDDGVMTMSGAGWELILDAPVIETAQKTLLESREMSKLPMIPIDVGRYHTVFDAFSMAQLLSMTVGAATEIDRVLGYEANAGGTSYLNAPEEMLEIFQVGAPLLTVTANRSEPKGAATTRWDDEGVTPVNTTLIENGILRDFQMSREGAAWMTDAYNQKDRSPRSAGYVFGDTAMNAPLIHTGNIAMKPGTSPKSYQELEGELDRGMSVVRMTPKIDFQLSSGAGHGFQCYEIRNGKRVARIADPGVLFRTSEIWKGLSALGGPESMRSYGFIATKGEPEQFGFHTASAVPAIIRDVTFTDPKRR